MKIALINQITNHYDTNISREYYMDKIKKASKAADIIVGPEFAISNISRPINYYKFIQFCEQISEYANDNKLIIPGTGFVFSNEKKFMSNIAPVITKEGLRFISKYYITYGERRAAKKAGLDFKQGKEGEEIFSYNGFNIGLEICYDHLDGRLKKSINKHKDIKLEFLIACALDNSVVDRSIIPKQNIAVTDGLFCLNDGFELEGKDRIYGLKVKKGSFSRVDSIDMGEYTLIEHELVT